MHRSNNRYFVELSIHAVFWLLVYYALKALTANAFQLLARDHNGLLSQDGQMPFPYAWIVLLFLMGLFYTSCFWVFRQTRRLLLPAAWLLLFYGMNFAVIGLLSKPTRDIIPAAKALLPGLPPLPGFTTLNWQNLQPVIALIFLLVMGLAAAYYYIRESISKEIMRSKTELQFLRAQVNPHFLFNTLNNLFSLAQKEGSDQLAGNIAQLSGMMRYMLYESNTEWVGLAQEITYLKDCIALYRLRFSGKLVKVVFNHPDPVPGIVIAPMLFIVFLENAFKHGTAPGQASAIFLRIIFDGTSLSFTCENPDYSRPERADGEKGGIGLENVRRRLELLYPGRHILTIATGNGSYRVHLQIDVS
jgi:two-component system LytT family sensor kinase